MNATSTCPICGHNNESIGILGSRAHFRCRQCGANWSTDGSTTDEEKQAIVAGLKKGQTIRVDNADYEVLDFDATSIMVFVNYISVGWPLATFRKLLDTGRIITVTEPEE